VLTVLREACSLWISRLAVWSLSLVENAVLYDELLVRLRVTVLPSEKLLSKNGVLEEKRPLLTSLWWSKLQPVSLNDDASCFVLLLFVLLKPRPLTYCYSTMFDNGSQTICRQASPKALLSTRLWIFLAQLPHVVARFCASISGVVLYLVGISSPIHPSWVPNQQAIRRRWAQATTNQQRWCKLVPAPRTRGHVYARPCVRLHLSREVKLCCPEVGESLRRRVLGLLVSTPNYSPTINYGRMAGYTECLIRQQNSSPSIEQQHKGFLPTTQTATSYLSHRAFPLCEEVVSAMCALW